MHDSGRIVIIGCGSFAKELIIWMIDSNLFKDIESRLYFVDDKFKDDFFIKNIKISSLGEIKNFKPFQNDSLYLGISKPKDKSKIVQLMDSRNARFESFIHPTALIASTCSIGRGCIIFPYSVCSDNSNLKEFISINLHSAIGHDVSVDSFSTISSFVDLTGKINVGKRVMIGSGARFLTSVKIGEDSLIGAGAIIFKSIPKGKTAYCQPAKIL